MGTHWHLSSPCWHVDHLDLGAGLVQAPIAVQFLELSGAGAHCFNVVLLSFSHFPLPRRSLGLGGRCDINVSLVSQTPALYTLTNCEFLHEPSSTVQRNVSEEV